MVFSSPHKLNKLGDLLVLLLLLSSQKIAVFEIVSEN